MASETARSSPFIENIASIAAQVVQECEFTHQTRVSQLLAAFVVRCISFSDPVKFDLTQPLSSLASLEMVKVRN